MKKIISLKEKDYKLRNRMKLNKKKVDDIFEILDSLLFSLIILTLFCKILNFIL